MATNNESIENCKSVFITWVWGIGIIAGIFVAGTGLAWAAATKTTTIESTLLSQDKRISDVEIATAKVDTVIQILRDMQKDQ